MASPIGNLDFNHLSTGFAGAVFLQSSGLAHTSACQGGRRGDVMVHRVLKFLSFALLFLFVIFSFSIVVKEFVKCRS